MRVALLMGVLGWDDFSSSLKVILVISELIPFFSLDDGIDNSLSPLHLLVESGGHDLHDLRRSDGEDSVSDVIGQLLNVKMAVGETILSRVNELIELGSHEVVEDVNRRESSKLVSFVQLNGLLDVTIRVVLGGFVVSSEVNIKLLEIFLNLGTSSHFSGFHLLGSALSLRVFSSESVFEFSDELGNHVPEKSLFLSGL